MMEHLSTFQSILKEYPMFDENTNDDVACNDILKEFSVDHQEEIANTSYAYWIVASKAPADLPKHACTNAALKEIRRHYIGEGRNIPKAVEAIRTALDYRRKYRMDILRSCFYDEHYESNGDEELVQKYKSLIAQDLGRQPMIVMNSVDCHRRTIVYKPPRTSHPIDADEAYLLTQLYTAERAMAVAEFQSQGKVEKLCVIFNFLDYSSQNSPSRAMAGILSKVLQNCYPERLGIMMILESPFWMRALFIIVWPFLSSVTTEKIKLSGVALQELVGSNDCNGRLKKFIENPEAMQDVNVDEYTQRPFYCGY